MNSTSNTQKPFDAEQHRLQERLQFFLDALHTSVRADVMYSLTSPGKLFAMPKEDKEMAVLPSGMWSLLSLFVAKYITYDTTKDYFYSVATALECFICALDLLDDIEDADQTSAVVELGQARVLNVSTTLLALTNHIFVSSMQTECSSELIVRVLMAVQQALLAATAGQHRDILAEQRDAASFTLEECIEIAEGKAGTLMSLACSIGALCANADDKEIEQFSEMGKLLGIAQQLDNDSHDLYHILQYEPNSPPLSIIKTDLVRQKKTLPIVLAAHRMSALQKSSIISEEERQKTYNDALHEGIITTWGISLLYRERAYDQLRQIEKKYPVPHALRFLLGFA